MSTVQIVMLAIKGVKLLQAMQKEGVSTEIRTNLISDAMPEASSEDVAAISTAIATIDPDFISRLCTGIGEALSSVLGGK